MITQYVSRRPPTTPASGALAEALGALREWTTEPAMTAPQEAQPPLWQDLLRFGLRGAALGSLVGLGVLVVNQFAGII